MSTEATPRPWRKGAHGSCIVSDAPVHGSFDSADSVKYYGGHLICESLTEANADLILAAVNAGVVSGA